MSTLDDVTEELVATRLALAQALGEIDMLKTVIERLGQAKARAAAAEQAELGWEPPVVLPPLWRVLERGIDGARYVNETQHLIVIVSAGREQDGRRWVHLSLSHSARPPRWRELRDAKDIFLGANRHALQVLPPASQYVNIHPNVLHLWHCIDEVPLPDFTRGGGTL